MYKNEKKAYKMTRGYLVSRENMLGQCGEVMWLVFTTLPRLKKNKNY